MPDVTPETPEEPKTEDKTDTSKILGELGPLADVLKTTAETVWKAFVMRYVARGLGEVLVAIFISLLSIRLLGTTTLWLFVPGALVTLVLYDAIQCLVNPTYWAMMDAMSKLKDLKQPEQIEVTQPGGRSY